MNFLFLFLDGVGLGENDPTINPFARADMPALTNLLHGRRLIVDSLPNNTERASLIGLDACLGVQGLPQSATGQATLLTGKNIPKSINKHFGPKPNKEVARFLEDGALFGCLKRAGQSVAFLNAYPPIYFEAINSGRRIHAAIPQAVVNAGVPLRTAADLAAGQAISADFTARGWHTHLNQPETPVISPMAAGERLGELAKGYDFSFFEYWLSDYAGHKQGMSQACDLMESFDQVLAGLLKVWQDETGLILVTSDHGNIEDLSTRRHTTNLIPALLIGAPSLRHPFIRTLKDLTDVAPAIMGFLKLA